MKGDSQARKLPSNPQALIRVHSCSFVDNQPLLPLLRPSASSADQQAFPPSGTSEMDGPTKPMEYDSVLFVGFGGPRAADEIRPFLENVVRGRNVPPERVEEVAHHYEAVGRRSP